MKASEARKATAIALKRAQADSKLKEEQKKKAEIEAAYTTREVWFPDYYKNTIRKNIREAANSCLDSIVISHESEVIIQMTIDKLQSEGFDVRQLPNQFIQSYQGSNDDGYAYAHDAYTLYSIKVKW